MIEFLKIENLALLERAEIDFRAGFTAVTGETGAGKERSARGALDACGREDGQGGRRPPCPTSAARRRFCASKIPPK